MLHETEEFQIPERAQIKTDRRTIEKFILNSSKGLVETYQQPNRKGAIRVQFIHETVRTYFWSEDLHHLTNEQGVIGRTTAMGSTESVLASDRKKLIACIHDQLKEHCLAYLARVVWRRMCFLWERGKLLKPINIADDLAQDSVKGERLEDSPQRTVWLTKRCESLLQEMDSRKSQIRGQCPFVEYAVHGLWKHAEIAQSYGLQQTAFLGNLPLEQINVLDRRFSLYFASANMDIAGERACWYQACSLAANQCPELLEVALSAIAPSQLASWQWGVVIAENLAEAIVKGDRPVHYKHTGYRNPRKFWELARRILDAGAKPYVIDVREHSCLSATRSRGHAACLCPRYLKRVKRGLRQPDERLLLMDLHDQQCLSAICRRQYAKCLLVQAVEATKVGAQRLDVKASFAHTVHEGSILTRRVAVRFFSFNGFSLVEKAVSSTDKTIGLLETECIATERTFTKYSKSANDSREVEEDRSALRALRLRNTALIPRTDTSDRHTRSIGLLHRTLQALAIRQSPRRN